MADTRSNLRANCRPTSGRIGTGDTRSILPVSCLPMSDPIGVPGHRVSFLCRCRWLLFRIEVSFVVRPPRPHFFEDSGIVRAGRPHHKGVVYVNVQGRR